MDVSLVADVTLQDLLKRNCLIDLLAEHENVICNYKCPICLELFKRPIQGSTAQYGCGHSFCAGCIQKQPDGSFICPLCRAAAMPHPDAKAAREMLQLRIRCINGCGWVGPIAMCVDHLSSQGGCPRQLLPCHLDCGGNVPRLTMMNHIQTTCPKRQVTCNYCRVKLRQFEFREHCKTCPDYPIQCKCGVNVARKMVSSHEALCPEHLVACPYSWVGCNHKFPRKGQASHEMEYMTIHNKYMLATIIKGEEERALLTEKIESMTKLRASDEEKISELTTQLSDLKAVSADLCLMQLLDWVNENVVSYGAAKATLHDGLAILQGVVRRSKDSGKIAKLFSTEYDIESQLSFTTCFRGSTRRLKVEKDHTITVSDGQGAEVSLSGIAFIAVPALKKVLPLVQWNAKSNKTPKYAKIGEIVVLEGSVTCRPSGSIIVGTLPSGYRPTSTLIFSCCTGENSQHPVFVYPEGNIEVGRCHPLPKWISLSGITFVASKIFTATERKSLALHYWAASTPPVATKQQNIVVIDGLVQDRRGDLITILPEGFRPRKTLSFTVCEDKAAYEVEIHPSGSVLGKKKPTNDWVSLSGIIFSVN